MPYGTYTHTVCPRGRCCSCSGPFCAAHCSQSLPLSFRSLGLNITVDNNTTVYWEWRHTAPYFLFTGLSQRLQVTPSIHCLVLVHNSTTPNLYWTHGHLSESLNFPASLAVRCDDDFILASGSQTTVITPSISLCP